MPTYTLQKKLKKLSHKQNSQEQTSSMTESTNNVLLPEELNAENLTVTAPRKRGDRQVSYLLHNGEAIYAETPWLRAPFGVSGFEPESGGAKQWSINLSASPTSDDAEENEVIENWFKQWSGADELMLRHGVENAAAITGGKKKKLTKDAAEAICTPVVKMSNDKDGNPYPPRLQPKIPCARDPEDSKKTLANVPNVSVFYEGSDEPVEFETFDELAELVPKGSVVKAILQPRVWYIGGKTYGLSLAVLSLLVRKRTKSRPEGYAFSVPAEHDGDDSDAEEADEEQPDSDAEEAEEEGGEEEAD